MSEKLSGKKIAILATDGYEQSELFEPHRLLKEAGAEVSVISLKAGEIKGWDNTDWGKSIAVDQTLSEADANDFDALVLPGGVINPDKLRMEESAMNFIKEFINAEKTVAAICHAPWLLAEAGAVEGKNIASWASIKTDLENAGAKWQDEEVVQDGNLITSRNPDDIPAFTDKIIEVVSQLTTKSANA